MTDSPGYSKEEADAIFEQAGEFGTVMHDAFERGSYYYCLRLIARYKRLLNKERIGLYEQI